MRAERGRKNSTADEKLKVVALSAREQTRKIQEVIARRAYEIFVSRGAECGNELKDWREAENELIKPLCCGLMSVGENLWVEVDPAVFEPGSIEYLGGSPQLTICGKPHTSDTNTHKRQAVANRSLEMIFRVIDLPLEIDPSGVTAKFRGASLEILLRKVQANLSLPDSRGIETLDWLTLAAGGLPTLVLAGMDERGLALDALRRGGKDYLLEGRLDRDSFVRAIRNMAERQAAEEALFVEKERAQVTLNSIGDAVLSTDNKGRVTYLNAVAEKITGWTAGEAAGKPVEEVFVILDSTTGKISKSPLRSAIELNRTVGLTPNCIIHRRDGGEFAIDDSAAPTRDRQGWRQGL
jgi:PAS domain S-box-containing protein